MSFRQIYKNASNFGWTWRKISFFNTKNSLANFSLTIIDTTTNFQFQHINAPGELEEKASILIGSAACISLALLIKEHQNWNIDNCMLASSIIFELGGRLAEYFKIPELVAEIPLFMTETKDQFINYCQEVIFGDGNEDEFEETPDSFGMMSILS